VIDRAPDRLAVTGERLDRLMTVEARPMSGGLPPGIVVPIYEACRAHHGEPLSSLAARRLVEVIRPNSTVFIVTGAGVAPDLPLGETDGPPGAASLARALAGSLGARVILLADERHAGAVAAVAAVVQASLPGDVAIDVLAMPDIGEGMRASLDDLIDRESPVAVVFIEVDGPNPDGHFHGVRGNRRPPGSVVGLHLLADAARMRGILTIGIGDGGNEVGFGGVRDQVAAIHPYGFVVTTARTDVVVSTAISNWGAYAVTAALAVAVQDRGMIHQPDLELGFIAASLSAGARDGATSSASLAVDGVAWNGHAAFVGLIASVAASAIESHPVGPHASGAAVSHSLIH
jgi:hypothetical protein